MSDPIKTAEHVGTMTKKEALEAFHAYYDSLHEWENKTARELESELANLMDHEGPLTIKQRSIIGVARVLCEKYGLDNQLGDLSLQPT